MEGKQQLLKISDPGSIFHMWVCTVNRQWCAAFMKIAADDN